MSQDSLLARLNELPRIRKVLQELLDMVNKNDVDFEALSEKISMDQVLSARLLRMANSAYFGGRKSIFSVNDALVRVGVGPVKTLVIASVLSSVFSKVDTLDLSHYWEDTFEVSVISSKLATAVGLDANDVFTLGILHNIGELMIHALVPEEAKEIARRVEQGADPIATQEEVLDISAPSLGAKLARAWKFPDEMVDAIEHYHEPREADISPKLAATLHFACAIHQEWDQLENEMMKANYLAEHPDSRLLHISDTFYEVIDKFRGNGRELATQMMAVA